MHLEKNDDVISIIKGGYQPFQEGSLLSWNGHLVQVSLDYCLSWSPLIL
jgi:hypothetical protein